MINTIGWSVVTTLYGTPWMFELEKNTSLTERTGIEHDEVE
jgi:hypothetical protein